MTLTADQQTTASPHLSPTELEQYRLEGYLMTGRPLFPQPKFEALRSHFEGKLSRLPADVRPEAMDVPHFTDVKLFNWLFSDEVLNLVESIIGPDIALWSSHFICKPKGNGKRVPWHEDSYYWKGRLTPMEVCTVWLAIDPSTRANGCMNVIPRTLHGFSDYDVVDEKVNVFGTEIRKHQVDEQRKVAIELQPNHCSLHDGRLMHGSDANTSSIRRCGYTMRYMSTRVKLVEEKNPGHQIYLARGRDLAGNRYADPTRSYDELAQFREEKGIKVH
jgi:hypothetical protein